MPPSSVNVSLPCHWGSVGNKKIMSLRDSEEKTCWHNPQSRDWHREEAKNGLYVDLVQDGRFYSSQAMGSSCYSFSTGLELPLTPHHIGVGHMSI